MKLFIVAVPLFTADMAVDSYRMIYRKADRLLGTDDNFSMFEGAMVSPGIELINEVGLEPFTGGKRIFVEMNHFLLLARAPFECRIPFESFICVFGPDITPDPMYLELARELKSNGFSIALMGMDYNNDTEPYYFMADYLIVNASDQRELSKALLAHRRYAGLTVVYDNVDDPSAFQRLKAHKDALFSGKFYNIPITAGKTKIAPLKANALRLINTVANEDFDLTTVAKVIQQDASLSISLLRFINSPSVGRTYRLTSVSQAIAMLGQKEVRKWITTAVSTALGEDKPSEITKMSLIRAKFAENLAYCFEMAMDAPNCFLMGLFSFLDVILEMPMDKAVEQVALDERVKEALLGKPGRLNSVLGLMYAYERAEWIDVSYYMLNANSDVEAVSKAFMDALMWYKGLLDSLNEDPGQPEPSAKAAR